MSARILRVDTNPPLEYTIKETKTRKWNSGVGYNPFSSIRERKVKSASHPSVAHRVGKEMKQAPQRNWLVLNPVSGKSYFYQNMVNFFFLHMPEQSTSCFCICSCYKNFNLLCGIKKKQAGFPTFFMIQSSIKEESSERGVALWGEEMEWGSHTWKAEGFSDEEEEAKMPGKVRETLWKMWHFISKIQNKRSSFVQIWLL